MPTFWVSRRRRGLALVELLVILVVIAILLVLLLPAVQKVREGASRLNCANNLKQIGLAVRSHHDAFGQFPYGGWNVYPLESPSAGDPHATNPLTRAASWSWAYQLLPYIEQTELFRNPDPTAVRTAPVKRFYCPSRRSAQAYNGMAKIDYAANAGSMSTGANGVVMQTSLGAIRLADITDGTGCTLLVGEKQLNNAAFGRSSDDDESYCTAGWNGDWEVYRWGRAQPARDFGLPGATDPQPAFGSAHAVGFNCAFCDGSVRYIPYSVDLTVWTRACVRNDNQAFNPNDL